jgi:hypothetical protein
MFLGSPKNGELIGNADGSMYPAYEVSTINVRMFGFGGSA